MTDTNSLEGTGEPVVSFNMNEATGLYGTGSRSTTPRAVLALLDTFAYGYWVLTTRGDPGGLQRSDLFSSSSEVAWSPTRSTPSSRPTSTRPSTSSTATS